MDLFEKQQTIEATKMAVRARWFYILVVLFQGLIIKLIFPKLPLIASPMISLMGIVVLISNLCLWLYFRRPMEKIGNLGLKIVKGSIVPFDQLALSVIFYFSGTANKMLFIIYFILILLGASLYKTKGVVLITILTSILYSSLVLLEYFGLMPYVSPEAYAQSSFKSLKGDWFLAGGQLLAFNLYLLMVVIVANYLANLFKRRENSLMLQRDELSKKTETLMLAQNELQSALMKSDIARKVATRARDDIEKANVELKQKMEELERFYKMTVGREVKMEEMKSEIKKLKETIKKLGGKPPKE
jgi:hypothetical protein